MKVAEPSKHRRLFRAAIALASVAAGALPLIALAWWRTQIMHNDFGMEITPAVQWFWDRRLPAFLFVGLACMAAGVMLRLFAGNRKAIYLAIALAALAIMAEATIATCCIILPIAALVRDLS